MRVADFAIVCDENLDDAVVEALRTQQRDVLRAAQLVAGKPTDTSILQSARVVNRLAITHDRDFGQLAIQRGEPIIGIIFIRPGHLSWEKVLAALDMLFNLNPEVRPPFLIVVKISPSGTRIRIREW